MASTTIASIKSDPTAIELEGAKALLEVSRMEIAALTQELMDMKKERDKDLKIVKGKEPMEVPLVQEAPRTIEVPPDFSHLHHLDPLLENPTARQHAPKSS